MATKAPTQTYRELQAELDHVLAELQSPDVDIDKALELYKHGQKLVVKLEQHLKSAKNEVTRLKK